MGTGERGACASVGRIRDKVKSSAVKSPLETRAPRPSTMDLLLLFAGYGRNHIANMPLL